MATAWDYIAIVIFIVFSAFFSGSEIAYASVNELRLKKAAEAENGNKLAKLAYSIYSNYDDALITILIGNNLVNIASSSVATVIAIDIMGDKGTWVATAIMTVNTNVRRDSAKDNCRADRVQFHTDCINTAQGAYDNHVPHSMGDTARSQGAR